MASSSLRRRSTAEGCVHHSLHILPTVDHRPHKLVIAHRGASYHMPEHTLPAYRLALELGADFIEPDIVSTADRKLIAMHSVDLNVTTNVREVFPDREPWFSPYAKKLGFWSFNFTFEETSQLRVKQRLPLARTTRYDNLFKVPSLLEIVEELNLWNEEDLPKTLLHTTQEVNTDVQPLIKGGKEILRKPSVLELSESGIYLELKDYAWQKEEAGIDLVELMFQHFLDYSFEWDWTMPCYQELEYDTYKVPGLVIQSFEMDSLKRFHDMWMETKDASSVPEPPYVILADIDHCNQDQFWEDLVKFSEFLSGVGPDKRCLIPENETSVPEESMTSRRARTLNLAIHPWTERPEKSFLANSKFDSIAQETNYLLHDLGVEGIFSESVATAVTAAKMGGPDGLFQSNEARTSPQCYNIDRELGTYIGLSLFIMGCLVGGLFCIMGKRNGPREDDPEIEPMLLKGPPSDDQDVFVPPHPAPRKTAKAKRAQGESVGASAASNTMDIPLPSPAEVKRAPGESQGEPTSSNTKDMPIPSPAKVKRAQGESMGAASSNTNDMPIPSPDEGSIPKPRKKKQLHNMDDSFPFPHSHKEVS